MVEDDELVRYLVGANLERNHFFVLEAGDADNALAVSHAFPGKIDVLLADVTLPGLSGCDLATLMQSARPDIVVLLMSGLAVECMPAKPTVAFIQKPFTAESLMNQIQAALKAHCEHVPHAEHRN